MKLRINKRLRLVLYAFTTRVIWRDSRPRSMYRRNRDERLVESHETVHLRWWGDHFAEGIPLPNHVAVPDQSANRSATGGRFWTVLLPDPSVTDSEKRSRQLSMGVIRFKVQHHEFTFVTNEGTSFCFRFESDALDYNFHHCELRAFRNSVRLTRADARALKGKDKTEWTEAAKQFRDHVSKQYRRNRQSIVVLTAEVATSGKELLPH